MNKQLSVMGLAARASMVPVLIASGLTALAVGTLTYLANPEHTGGAAGVGAAPLAAAVGCLMVMVMLWRGAAASAARRPYTVRRLRLREELVDLWWAAYHAAMLLVLWALVADGSAAGDAAEASGAGAQLGCRPQSLMLLVYSDSFLHHLLPLADAAGVGDGSGAADGQCTGGGPVHPEPAAGTAVSVAAADGGCHDVYLHGGCRRQCVDGDAADGAGPYGLDAGAAVDRR